jgi:hypothetical protein
MNRDNNIFDEGRVRKAFEPLSVPPQPRRGPSLDDEADLDAIADSEGWRVPPREVTCVALRPWQQAVFWGLRIYIVVMLAIMVVGFVRVAVG